jgi:hypothetical protein
MQYRTVRLVNVALGIWLLASSFAWRRPTANFINLWVTGLVVIVSSLLSVREPRLRFVTAGAGVWLITSLFAWTDYSSAMVWNNVIVGAAIALTSLIGPREAEMLSSPS